MPIALYNRNIRRHTINETWLKISWVQFENAKSDQFDRWILVVIGSAVSVRAPKKNCIKRKSYLVFIIRYYVVLYDYIMIECKFSISFSINIFFVSICLRKFGPNPTMITLPHPTSPENEVSSKIHKKLLEWFIPLPKKLGASFSRLKTKKITSVLSYSCMK